MPPVPLWYCGRTDYGRFIARVFTARGTGWRMDPTVANGQPALAAYCADHTGVLRHRCLSGRPAFISFQTAAELRHGALPRSWGASRMRKPSTYVTDAGRRRPGATP